MSTGIYETTDIPKEKVKEVEAGYRLNSPTNVVRIAQSDGLWTVCATFPGDGKQRIVFGEQ